MGRDVTKPVFGVSVAHLDNEIFQKANNKGTDQTAGMRRLVCAFAVRKPRKTGFLTSRPIWSKTPICLFFIVVIKTTNSPLILLSLL